MKYFIWFPVVAFVVCIGGVLFRISSSADIPQLLAEPAKSSAVAPSNDPGWISEYGALTRQHTDTDHNFSIRYPETFLAKRFSEWVAIVDNDTKASIWLGFCPPDCTHLAGAPFSDSGESYAQDSTVTREDSREIPSGEGRRIHVLSNREFITDQGTHAIEQLYEVTGFNTSTGNAAMVECGEDTQCEVAGPFLRYIFFTGAKGPYIALVRVLPPHKEQLEVIKAMASTVAY